MHAAASYKPPAGRSAQVCTVTYVGRAEGTMSRHAAKCSSKFGSLQTRNETGPGLQGSLQDAPTRG